MWGIGITAKNMVSGHISVRKVKMFMMAIGTMVRNMVKASISGVRIK